jgi:hypothetical protein
MNNPMLKGMKKKKEKKEENPYFQRQPSKRASHVQRSIKSI